MPGLRVAKASEQDIEITRSFLQACEFFWDARPIYSLRGIKRKRNRQPIDSL
jgi:hypothetical protein